MLFCVASLLRGRSCPHRLTQRRSIVQLNLNFLDRLLPEASVWDALEDEQRAVVIDALARLFVKATVALPLEEGPTHE
jgi:hypothetical protein